MVSWYDSFVPCSFRLSALVMVVSDNCNLSIKFRSIYGGLAFMSCLWKVLTVPILRFGSGLLGSRSALYISLFQNYITVFLNWSGFSMLFPYLCLVNVDVVFCFLGQLVDVFQRCSAGSLQWEFGSIAPTHFEGRAAATWRLFATGATSRLFFGS